MCEATAYLIKDGKEEKILESVDKVEILDDEIKMVNIFGEQKMIRARLKSYNNSQGKLLFEAWN